MIVLWSTHYSKAWLAKGRAPLFIHSFSGHARTRTPPTRSVRDPLSRPPSPHRACSVKDQPASQRTGPDLGLGDYLSQSVVGWLVVFLPCISCCAVRRACPCAPAPYYVLAALLPLRYRWIYLYMYTNVLNVKTTAGNDQRSLYRFKTQIRNRCRTSN